MAYESGKIERGTLAMWFSTLALIIAIAGVWITRQNTVSRDEEVRGQLESRQALKQSVDAQTMAVNRQTVALDEFTKAVRELAKAVGK